MASFLKQRQVFINATTTPVLLQIMDVLGKVHFKENISERQNTIYLSELPAGMLIFVSENQRYKFLRVDGKRYLSIRSR